MVKPLLAQFAVHREKELPLEGNYDSFLSLWTTMDGEPLIQQAQSLMELRTKTQTGRETDDEESVSLLELLTKTKTGRESDDEEYSQLLELVTKTDTTRERDDQE